MQRFLDILSRTLASLSLTAFVFGLCLAPPDIATAQTGQNNCTNGGGGQTTCKANADNSGCTQATEGKQCDTALACTCQGGTSQNPCVCAGSSSR